MKLRHPGFSAVMAWIVTMALTLSPLMAQTAPDMRSRVMAPHNEDGTGTTKDSEPSTVDTSVLREFSLPMTARAFPTVSRSSTLPSASADPTKPSSDVEAPGQSKWVILAAVIITGAVVGTILLLRGLGGGKDTPHPPTPTGTIITAGQPAVTVPTH